MLQSSITVPITTIKQWRNFKTELGIRIRKPKNDEIIESILQLLSQDETLMDRLVGKISFNRMKGDE